MDPSTLMTIPPPQLAASPFAGSFDIPSSLRFLPISKESPIGEQKRYGVEATGHPCSTSRMQRHSPIECARTMYTTDIEATSPGSIRDMMHSQRYGSDNRDTQQPYSPHVQRAIGAQPALYEVPSSVGLLGDARLGASLPHRSSSYKFYVNQEKNPLRVDDIEGAQPRQLSRFLNSTNRHTNNLMPAYNLPAAPKAVGIPSVKASGRNSLEVRDIQLHSDPRNLFGTQSAWADAFKRDGIVRLKRNLRSGLERASSSTGALQAATGIATYDDVVGNSPGSTLRFTMMKRFGRDNRNPLGSDVRLLTKGPTCPGVAGSSFETQRCSNPVDPTYRIGLPMPGANDLAAGVSTAQQALPANTGDSKSSEIKVFEQADTLSSSPTSLRNMETLKGRAGHMIVDYGFVKGSLTENPHLTRLRYKGKDQQGHSPVTQDTVSIAKSPTMLNTTDVEGAEVSPVAQIKSQIGSGVYGGAYRKTSKVRRQQVETNKVFDIAGKPQGRPKYDTMFSPGRAYDLSATEQNPPPERAVRNMRTCSNPVMPVYQWTGVEGKTLTQPEGSWNSKHVHAARVFESRGVDRRGTMHVQEMAKDIIRDIAAVEALP